jgi:hypothetical protein
MARSFDELVKRTTNAKTRQRAAARTRELLGELLLSGAISEITVGLRRRVSLPILGSFGWNPERTSRMDSHHGWPLAS